jgi:hypothetical protein
VQTLLLHGKRFKWSRILKSNVSNMAEFLVQFLLMVHSKTQLPLDIR